MDKTTKTIEYFLTSEGLMSIVSVFVLLIIIFYVVYAFLMTKQVRLLNKSYSSPLSGVFKQAAFIHLVASVVLVVLALAGIL